jgi:glutamate-5-semialdehyde dehydrogenase
MGFINTIGSNAQDAKKSIKTATTQQKNQVLQYLITQIQESSKEILAANTKDIENGKQNGLDDALLDRLMLNDERLNGIIQSLEQIIALPDPVGEITHLNYRPSGIQVGKMRTPLGVIGIIYESRPNVTIDAAALCLKSGNCAILRGGKEAIHSNIALQQCITNALNAAQLNEYIVQLITDTNRELVGQLVASPQFVDCIIPRGGKGLVAAISNSAKVPVIKHLDGICHTFIDKDADIRKAIAVAFNGKTRRYGVCNATETLLIHKDFDVATVVQLLEKYIATGVELRGCEHTQKLHPAVAIATEQDWETEYLAPILSIKIVDSFAEACNHIEQYSSKHTETIITENLQRGRDFLATIDSASVMINASTGFADGFEYGLGAEIGISTDKFHVRGPVGLEGLTSQKYIVLGDGHIRK